MTPLAYRERNVATCVVCRLSAVDATLFLKHTRNGNTYRVTVEQIGGVE